MEAEGRIENLLELVAQMREYEKEAEEPTLRGFLERIALASDVDGYDPEKGAISLMTVHTAKGLEFPVVFLTGLEERVFPHARSVDDDSAVEEERRLCYVAVTRARKRLFLSRVRRRRLSGRSCRACRAASCAICPPECVESIVMARPAEYGGGYGDSEGPVPGAAAGRATRRRASAAHARRRPAARPPGRRAGGRPGEITVDYDDDDVRPGQRAARRRQAAPPIVRRRRGARLAGGGQRT